LAKECYQSTGFYPNRLNDIFQFVFGERIRLYEAAFASKEAE